MMRPSSTTLTHDDLVASRESEALELVRAQETELPQALKWQLARADEDYDAALVEARRITVDTACIASESVPMAIPPEEAERRCRRALMEAWIGRESATFRLPPSRLGLDPADVIRLVHAGREVELRLVSIADSAGRGIEAVRQDRAVYDLPPGDPRPSASTNSRTASVAAIPLPSHSSSEGPPMSDISTHLGLPYLLGAHPRSPPRSRQKACRSPRSAPSRTPRWPRPTWPPACAAGG